MSTNYKKRYYHIEILRAKIKSDLIEVDYTRNVLYLKLVDGSLLEFGKILSKDKKNIMFSSIIDEKTLEKILATD